MTETPPSPQVKKSNRLVAVAIIMLLIGGAIGGIIGWSIGQNQPQSTQSGYTRLTVLQGSEQTIKLLGYNYIFLYKSTIFGYDPQKPIEVDVQGNTYTLAATQGSKYDFAGIEVVVSESQSDYVILSVKPL